MNLQNNKKLLAIPFAISIAIPATAQRPKPSQQINVRTVAQKTPLASQLKLTKSQRQKVKSLYDEGKAERDRIFKAFQRSTNNQSKAALRDQMQAQVMQTFNKMRRTLSQEQAQLLEVFHNQQVNDLKAKGVPGDEGPIAFAACVAACELACIALPSGPFCDCYFCTVLIWAPGP